MNNPPKKTKTQSIRQIGEFATVEDFTKHGLGLIVDATKAVKTFPAGASRDLYSAYPTFGKVVESQSNRILEIISSVLKQQNIKGNIQRRQQVEQFELLLDCNDVMLERVNSNLDDIAGIKRNPETILVETILPNAVVNTPNKSADSRNTTSKRPEASPSQQSTQLLTAENTARPQVNFKVPVDNSAANPFIPKIKDKPNSLKPLAVLPEYDDDGMIESYLHPYEFELSKFAPAKDQLTNVVAKKPQDIEKTPLVHVADEQKLKSLLYDLRNVQEFAVDLEHHSYRTFQGITCLMLISTRHKDYIIDALALREDLHILNEVFTHPKILKIFHKTHSDIEWLQRDLSLYVVNMFDTWQAAKLIGLPRSLAYLLKHYFNIQTDKPIQLADWRIRPLPEQLISYARQGTHYLIYIYEMLRNELLSQANGETNLLITAYKQSVEICKTRYQKPRILADSHLDIYRKSKRLFDNRQLFALKEIFAWRDKIARLDDESYAYVLPTPMMLQISESLPREMQGILACCNPIPPLVRQNLHILHQIVLKAREQPIVKNMFDNLTTNVGQIPKKPLNRTLRRRQQTKRKIQKRKETEMILINLASDLEMMDPIDLDSGAAAQPFACNIPLMPQQQPHQQPYQQPYQQPHQQPQFPPRF